VWDRSHEVTGFIEEGLFSGGRSLGPAKSLGFVDGNGAILAGVAYHDFDAEARVIEISAFAIRRDWLTKGNLRTIFDYPFGQLNCRICVARISEKNHRALRIWNALGAKMYRLPKLRGPNEDEMFAILSSGAWEKKWSGAMTRKLD